MRILREDSIGLIIDMQEKLYPHIFENEKLTHNTSILIKGLLHMEVPILVAQQYTEALGHTIAPIQEALGEFSYFEKTSFSCCDMSDFTKDMEDSRKKFVIIAGIEAHVCVLQTAVDLIEKGYIPVIIEDCISSRDIKNKETAVKRMISEGAIISSYESILFELCRDASYPYFRAISKLVK